MEEEFKDIVHIFGTDIKGNLILPRALMKIKGIGYNLSKALSRIISEELGVNENIEIGKLSSEQIKKLEELIKNPKVPEYMLNKRKDKWSGLSKHLVGSELIFDSKQCIEFEKNIYTWRGFRHAYGQKVRGQCTRTSGRKGLTVGVLRSERAKALAKEKEKEEKKK